LQFHLSCGNKIDLNVQIWWHHNFLPPNLLNLGKFFLQKNFKALHMPYFFVTKWQKLVAKKNIDCKPFGYKYYLTYNLELLYLFTNKMFLHFIIVRFKNHKDLTQHIFTSWLLTWYCLDKVLIQNALKNDMEKKTRF
jgi:hypothetical protein